MLNARRTQRREEDCCKTGQVEWETLGCTGEVVCVGYSKRVMASPSVRFPGSLLIDQKPWLVHSRRSGERGLRPSPTSRN
jgi:hypothetical protein